MIYIDEKECSIYKGLRAFRDTWRRYGIFWIKAQHIFQSVL